jgi:hypothetical protein
MSKRRKRSQGAQEAEGGRTATPGSSGEARPGSGETTGARGAAARRADPSASDWSLALQLLFLAGVFAVTVVVAELAGAANLGVALGVGQITFAIAVVYLLVRR